MLNISSLTYKLKHSELLIQTSVSFIVRIIGAVSGFAVSVVLGRQLGAEEAGYYFLSLSIVTFIASFSRIGLDNTVLRFTGTAAAERDNAAISSVMKRALSIALIASMVLAVVLYFTANLIAVQLFTKPSLTPVLQAMSIGIVGVSLSTLIAISLQGLKHTIESVFILNIAINLMIIILFALFSFDSSIQVATAYSAAALVSLLIAITLWLRRLSKFNNPQPTDNQIPWRVLFQSCLPLWVVMIMTQLIQLSGQFIAGAWVSPEEIAHLAVAKRTAMLTSFILMAVNMVIAPRLAAMYKQGKLDEIRGLALTSVRLMVIVALPVISMMLAFPEFLMQLFGEGFASGAHLLQILAIGQFINVSAGSVGFLLSMSGHEKDLRNTTLICGPIAVASALVFVPIYGATGAAISTALAMASQNLIAVFWVKKRLGFNTLAIWEKI